ncbi:hypothetical protein HDV00_008376 [Rhizophlyctis rosea]|nr:hypothetical protein HDV00_008376 [Rhizophlyctis rosea]
MHSTTPHAHPHVTTTSYGGMASASVPHHVDEWEVASTSTNGTTAGGVEWSGNAEMDVLLGGVVDGGWGVGRSSASGGSDGGWGGDGEKMMGGGEGVGLGEEGYDDDNQGGMSFVVRDHNDEEMFHSYDGMGGVGNFMEGRVDGGMKTGMKQEMDFMSSEDGDKPDTPNHAEDFKHTNFKEDQSNITDTPTMKADPCLPSLLIYPFDTTFPNTLSDPSPPQHITNSNPTIDTKLFTPSTHSSLSTTFAQHHAPLPNPPTYTEECDTESEGWASPPPPHSQHLQSTPIAPSQPTTHHHPLPAKSGMVGAPPPPPPHLGPTQNPYPQSPYRRRVVTTQDMRASSSSGGGGGGGGTYVSYRTLPVGKRRGRTWEDVHSVLYERFVGGVVDGGEGDGVVRRDVGNPGSRTDGVDVCRVWAEVGGSRVGMDGFRRIPVGMWHAPLRKHNEGCGFGHDMSYMRMMVDEKEEEEHGNSQSVQGVQPFPTTIQPTKPRPTKKRRQNPSTTTTFHPPPTSTLTPPVAAPPSSSIIMADTIPPPTTTDPQKPRHVNRACTHCKKAHLACDAARPCKRCAHSGRADCVDVEHKRRGRPRSSGFLGERKEKREKGVTGGVKKGKGRGKGGLNGVLGGVGKVEVEAVGREGKRKEGSRNETLSPQNFPPNLNHHHQPPCQPNVANGPNTTPTPHPNPIKEEPPKPPSLNLTHYPPPPPAHPLPLPLQTQPCITPLTTLPTLPISTFRPLTSLDIRVRNTLKRRLEEHLLAAPAGMIHSSSPSVVSHQEEVQEHLGMEHRPAPRVVVPLPLPLFPPFGVGRGRGGEQ